MSILTAMSGINLTRESGKKKSVFEYQTRLYYSHIRWLKACNYGFKNQKNGNIRIKAAKKKALISQCDVAANLRLHFYALEKGRFSHDVAQF